MKGFIGVLFIYLTYIIAGIMMKTWPFKNGHEGIEIFIIFNAILLFLLYISARIVNRYKNITGIITIVLWILISTVYGVMRMKEDYYLYLSGNWNKFFGWDLVLWEAGVPFYIGVSQIIFIVCHFLIRIYVDAPKYKDKSL
jgi:hypothetical protein